MVDMGLHESLPVIDEFNYPAIWRQRFLFSSSSVIFRKKLTATTTTTTFINKYPSSTDHFLFAGCQVKTLPIRFFTREKRKKKIKTVRNATIAVWGLALSRLYAPPAVAYALFNDFFPP